MTHKTSITEGVIWKQLLRFFFPILFGTFFQQLYNTADAVIVGHFVGKEALAMVGGSSSILTNLLVGFFVGLSSGATVLISQFYGAESESGVSAAVHTSIVFSLICGAVMTAAGLIFVKPVLVRMDTPQELMEGSLLYLRVYLAGLTFNILYNMGSGILRAVGDSRRPLYFLIVSCLVNIVLDLFFVAVLGMGVLGVALATVISELVSALMALAVLARTDDSYRLSASKLGMKGNMIRRILLIGFPAGMQSVLYSLSNIVIQSAINGLGTDTVAAWAAYSKIDTIFWMIINALGISITTFVGQNYGAGKMDRVRRGVTECLAIGFLFSFAVGFLIYFLGGPIYSLFTEDPVVHRIGREIINYFCMLYGLFVFIEVLSGALRGVGDSLVAMIVTALSICALRVVWILLAVPRLPGLKTIMFSYPLTWGIGSAVFIIYYYWFSPLSGRYSKARGGRKL